MIYTLLQKIQNSELQTIHFKLLYLLSVTTNSLISSYHPTDTGKSGFYILSIAVRFAFWANRSATHVLHQFLIFFKFILLFFLISTLMSKLILIYPSHREFSSPFLVSLLLHNTAPATALHFT